MRPGQQHNKRGRGRNRHRNGGGGGSGGGGGGGGNPLSRVYDSNGPDVKVRGTAQTIAEKYLQLGRDAQSSGDIVMAESYYQHAEHYLRIVAAAQAYQQQMQPQYRRPDEFDDEDGEDSGEGDGDDNGSTEPAAALPGAGDQPEISGEPAEFDNERPSAPQASRPQREFRDRDGINPRQDNQGNRERDGQGQNRFRPRWQDRRDRPQAQAGEGRGEQPVTPREPTPAPVRAEEPAAAPVVDEAPQWEAPSFLRRPAAVTAPVEAVEEAPALVERRPRGRPRRERPAEEAAAPAASDTTTD